jgi:hypothetical protein
MSSREGAQFGTAPKLRERPDRNAAFPRLLMGGRVKAAFRGPLRLL